MDAAALFRDVRAILFELDGTLIMTDRLSYTSYRRALAHWQRELEPDFFAALIGKPRRDVCKAILNQAKIDAPWTEFSETQRREFEELIQTTRIPLVAPAVRFLRAIPRPGMTICAVSPAPMDRIELLLNRSGLNRFFDTAVSGDDLPKPPEPDVYRSAIEVLGATPWQTIVIESTPAGVTGAARAGARVVANPTEATKRLEFPTAHLRVDKLDYLIQYL